MACNYLAMPRTAAMAIIAVILVGIGGFSTSFVTLITPQKTSTIIQSRGLTNENENVALQIPSIKNNLAQIIYQGGIDLSGSTNTTIVSSNVTVIGRIWLQDDATLKIENSVIKVIIDPSISSSSDDITLQDRSTLILSNCSLTIKKDLKPNYMVSGSIQLSNSSKLVAEDTIISCTNDMGIQCQGSSCLNMNRVTYAGIPLRSSLHYAIEDYTFENLLKEFHDGYHLRCIDNSTIHLTDSRIGKITTFGNSILTAENSMITYYYESESSEKATLTNSIVKMYFLMRYNSSITISEPLEGFHREWDSAQFYHMDESTRGDRIVDSRIDNVWLALMNCDTKLHETSLKILASHGGTLSITGSSVWLLESGVNTYSKIENSNIEYMLGYSDENLDIAISTSELSNLLLTSKEKMRVSVTDSNVENSYINHRWWTPKRGEINFTRCYLGNMSFAFTVLDLTPSRLTKMNFDGCLLAGNLVLGPTVAENDQLIISGSLRFGPKISLKNQFEPGQMVTRVYVINVTKGGYPLSQVPLKLVDGNRTVWEGATDDRGSSSFSLDFVDKYDSNGGHSYNMTSSYMLRTEFEGKTFSVAVGLLSDTPIQIVVQDSWRVESSALAASVFILLLAVVGIIARRATR